MLHFTTIFAFCLFFFAIYHFFVSDDRNDPTSSATYGDSFPSRGSLLGWAFAPTESSEKPEL